MGRRGPPQALDAAEKTNISHFFYRQEVLPDLILLNWSKSYGKSQMGFFERELNIDSNREVIKCYRILILLNWSKSYRKSQMGFFERDLTFNSNGEVIKCYQNLFY